MAFEPASRRHILTAGRQGPTPIRGCPSDIGGGWTRERPSDGHAGASTCRWLPCGCTTAAGAAMPIRNLRPWTGATPPSGCLVRHRGRWHVHAHATLPGGVAPDQGSFPGRVFSAAAGRRIASSPAVQPVCPRYRRGPGADPRRTPDRGLPGTSSHESAFRIPGDVGMRESPGSRVPGSISSPVLSRSR